MQIPVSSHIVKPNDIYSPYLLDRERSHYSKLMRAFLGLCDRHNGSEHANDSCVDALIKLEEYQKDILRAHPDNPLSRDETEQLFYRQALGATLRDDETPPDFNQLLDRVTAKFNARVLDLGQKQDIDGALSLLEQGGAVRVYHDKTSFVKTNPARSQIIANGKTQQMDSLNQPAPKFAEVIQALQSIGIFANQMIIHEGIVLPDTVRDAPYLIIQIPELICEIAVCDRIGEVILVNRPLIGPHIFARYDKEELVSAFGMKRIEYRGEWQDRLLQDVLGDSPADKSQRNRIPIQKFAKDQINKPVRLTTELLLIAILDYAAAQYQITGEWVLPTRRRTDPVPGWPGETWVALNRSGERGGRGLPQGMTLSEIQRIYGLKTGNKPIPDAIEKAVRFWKDEAILPKRQEVKDLSVESVLIAILDYAAAQYQTTGEWVLPTAHTTDPVPGWPGETWVALSNNGQYGGRGFPKGMTLSEIQKIYGLKTGIKPIPDAIQQAVRSWKDEAILPKRQEVKDMSVESVLIAILDYAAAQYQITGEWVLPTQTTTDPVPGWPGETWVALNSSGQSGYRGFPKGMTLPEIQKVYGLKTGIKPIPDAIRNAVMGWKEEQRLPQKIMEQATDDPDLYPDFSPSPS